MDSIEVDGVELFRLTTEEAEAVLAAGTFLGVPLVKSDFLRAHLAISKVFTCFDVALGRPSGGGPSWVVLHVVRVADGWARVRVEGVTCFSCKQTWMVGNPLDYQIYEGVTDPLAAIARARGRRTSPCPACGGGLPRPALAVEGRRAG